MKTNFKFARRGQGGHVTSQGLSTRIASSFTACRVALSLTALLALAGCVSTQSIVTGKARTPIAPEAVKVYLTEPSGAEDVALVTASAEKGYNTAQGVMDLCVRELRKKAAALGANGLVIQSGGLTQHTGTEFGTFVNGVFLADSTTKEINHVSAKAIYVKTTGN